MQGRCTAISLKRMAVYNATTQYLVFLFDTVTTGHCLSVLSYFSQATAKLALLQVVVVSSSLVPGRPHDTTRCVEVPFVDVVMLCCTWSMYFKQATCVQIVAKT
jgi:peroxiredoxin